MYAFMDDFIVLGFTKYCQMLFPCLNFLVADLFLVTYGLLVSLSLFVIILTTLYLSS